MYFLYEEINKLLKPEDTVYFLGDAADRGPRGWDLIKAIATNPQWIYIKGNHEQMLFDALLEYKEYDELMGPKQELLFYNGGENTFNDIIFGCNEAIDWTLSTIRKMPTHIELKNKDRFTISLSHAGYTPWPGKKPDEYSLIWGRKHIGNRWPQDRAFQKRIEIHGHTPIPENFVDMPDFLEDPGVFYYADEHKICVDGGAVWTKIGLALDIDTFDEYVFEGE
jgi:hypothetical protein